MTYVNGGTNEYGVALMESWAAVWTVDTPYIDVLRRDFFDENEDAIREAAENGGTFSDKNGQTGAVHAISTGGDLNGDGFPNNFDDASDYVAEELSAWVMEDGGAFEQAVADGYSR